MPRSTSMRTVFHPRNAKLVAPGQTAQQIADQSHNSLPAQTLRTQPAWKSRFACSSSACEQWERSGQPFKQAASSQTAPGISITGVPSALPFRHAQPNSGHSLPQTCRLRTARASRISHPASPSQRAMRLGTDQLAWFAGGAAFAPPGVSRASSRYSTSRLRRGSSNAGNAATRTRR